MNDSYTHIAVILDRSGSMGIIADDVRGGFNSFVDEQRKVPGKCTISLVQFDDIAPYEVLLDFRPVEDVKPLGMEYRPRGNTPLYDAVGRGIVNTGITLEKMAESERPRNVIFLIITDGQENASKEYSAAKVAEMTKHQQEKYNWKFQYLGANQDAIAEAAKFGVAGAMSANYAAHKVGAAIRTSGMKMSAARMKGLYAQDSVQDADLSYTDQEREELK